MVFPFPYDDAVNRPAHDSLPDVPVAAAPQARADLPSHPSRRSARAVYTLPLSVVGVLVAAPFGAASLGVSLLPRGLALQTGGSVLCIATGYGIGAVVGALARLAGLHPGRVVRLTAWAVAVVAWLGVVALVPSRVGWQDEQARSLSMVPPEMTTVGVVVSVAAGSAFLLLVARSLRALARVLERHLRWFVPAGWPSILLSGIASAALAVGFVGLSYQATRTIYAAVDASTAGQTPPTSPLRSGGPGSAQAWDSLGFQGRAFTSGGPTQAQIASLSHGQPVMEPIRVYVGLAVAPDATARAALAVQELERTGGFDRSTLVIATVTGTGWVDPDASTAWELATGGDVASVAMQYSYLPSWLSFIVDQAAAVEAGQELYDAVLAHWRTLPPDHRPRLVVFGESLGSFGGQGAWPFGATPDDVVRDVSAVVWIGPPGGSRLWPDWRSALRTGGTAWQPVIDGGRVARVFVDATGIPGDTSGWGARRVAIAAHTTDPVVYWAPSLAFVRPDWSTDLGPGVDPHFRWWPLTSFWSVGLDLAVGGTAPLAAGHNYGNETARAVVAALQPDGWTASDVDALQRLVVETRPTDD
jgi:uncharacterized membrane protein